MTQTARMIEVDGQEWLVTLGNPVGSGYRPEAAEVTHRFLRFSRGDEVRLIQAPLDYSLDDERDLCEKFAEAT